MGTKAAWTEVVGRWRARLILGRSGHGWMALIGSNDEQRLLDVLDGASDVLLKGPAQAVDEALVIAAAVGRHHGLAEFATWCEGFQQASSTRRNPFSRATIERMIADVKPAGAGTAWPGTLPLRLLDVFDDPQADVAGWGLYAAAEAARTLKCGQAPGVRRADGRSAWEHGRSPSEYFAWLVACLAHALLSRADKHETAHG